MKYIGMSKNLQQRWNNHKNANYFTSKLHVAIHAEGIDNFNMTHLADCFTRKDAELIEKMFISECGTKYPNGYNQTDGGYGTFGRKLTEKQMDRMRHRNPMQQEHIKQRASDRLKGVPNPRVGPLNNFWGNTGASHPGTKYKIIATNITTNDKLFLIGIKAVEDAGFTYRTVLDRAKMRGHLRTHNNHSFELVKL
jgi:group I intron endonuclease